jgi:CBS domain-containing protein
VDYLALKGMRLELACWWSLSVILVLGAAAGISSYFWVFQKLLEKGVGEVFGALEKVTAGQVASPLPEADRVQPEEGREAVLEKLSRSPGQIVPVVREGKLEGVIACDDVGRGAPRAEEMASRPAVAVRASETLAQAYRRMVASGHSTLPVVDGEDRPVGLLKLSQIVERLEEARQR